MSRFFTIISCLFLFGELTAQSLTCSGNLGDNIFLQGDFGRGTANILQTNPGIAPGFQYVTVVPFDDGKYTITNNMGQWPNNWPTWLQIGDNSSDPLGYMMVVNASYAPGIFYQQTIDGLCDNTLYEFTADVINIVKRDVTGHILPNVSFLIDNVERFTTGSIPQSELWTTFGFTFTTLPGQDQLTLTLRNNAPGGIGNDLALDNISFRPCGPASSIEIDQEGRVCENVLYPTLTAIIASDTGFVQWQISTDSGTSWSDIPGATGRTYLSDQLSAQTYLFRYLYGSTAEHLQNPKCRIVSESRQLEVVPVYFTIIDTLCDGLTFDLGGAEYGVSGIYEEHLVAGNGCDSIVTLDLTIVPDPGISADIESLAPACAGGQDGQIVISNMSAGAPPYALSLAPTGLLATNQAFTTGAGQYTVQIADRYRCTIAYPVEITDPLPFIISIAGEDSVRLGYSTALEVSGNYVIETILWQPEQGLSCSTCFSPTATPLINSTYVAVAISEDGCVATDSIDIVVDSAPRFFAPNIFTPNGDNINDSWGIMIDQYSTPLIERVVIYDRWGDVVFTASGISALDAHAQWDGRKGEKYVHPGVYVYVLELRMADMTIVQRSGNISLIR